MARRQRGAEGLLHELADTLAAAYGPSGWWPARTPFEVMVGAILVQNTAWRNTERAIENLRGARLLSPGALAACRLDTLKRLVKPAGYFNQKAERVRRFARWIVDGYGGSVARMRRVPLDDMRHALLAFNGIGPETADSILCYALGHPVFVADAYTRRIFARHGLLGPKATYHEMQELVMRALPHDQHAYAELHGHIVYLGKDHCSRRNPACDACPLNGWHRHDPAIAP